MSDAAGYLASDSKRTDLNDRAEALAEARQAATMLDIAIAKLALMSKPLDEPLPLLIEKIRKTLRIARDQVGSVAEYLGEDRA
jgi:hypothetical protein